MADVADVLDALYGIAVSACFPNGPNLPSVTGKVINIGEGWPVTEDLNAGLAAGESFVSVYLIPGASRATPQIMDFTGGIIVAPVHGLTAGVYDGSGVSLSGTANDGEYATLLVSGAVGDTSYSFASSGLTLATDMLAGLLTLVRADYPAAYVSGAEIFIPSAANMTMRIGAPGTMGRRIHRQSQQYQVTVWAPNPADRTAIGKPLHVALNDPVRLEMPDTSSCILHCLDVRMSDKEENKSLYRRDTIMEATIDTVLTYPGFEITTVDTQTDAGGPMRQTAS